MSLTLLDWRRQVFRLYAQIRTMADPAAAHQLWRETRNQLLMHHPDSPIPPEHKPTYAGAPVAPYDPALRFDLEMDTDVTQARLGIATGTDGIVSLDRIGCVHVPELGDLDVWWLASYGGGVFVPVKDATQVGKTTYGGGRYLLDTVKGADLGGDNGRLIIDFNFAYNPSCAYDPAWACPLAPPGNVLSSPVVAGELVG